MFTKGAFVIIKNEDDQILLVKRKDIPFWDFPGGKVEANETEKQCSIRETLEETGLIITPDYLIGIYEQSERKDKQYIYAATIKDGKLIEEGSETKQIKYFSRKQLPINLIPLRKTQIQDFFLNKRENYVIVKKNSFTLKIERLVRNWVNK